MAFFKNILNNLKHVFNKLRHKRNRSDKDIYKRAKRELSKETNTVEIIKKAELQQEEKEIVKLISPIVNKEKAEILVSTIDNKYKLFSKTKKENKIKYIYEIYELEKDIHHLLEKRQILEILKNKITDPEIVSTDKIDKHCARIRQILKRNKRNNQIILSDIEISNDINDLNKIDILLSADYLSDKFKKREIEKQNRDKQYYKKVNEDLNLVDSLIKKHDFGKAKEILHNLIFLIRKNDKQSLKQFNKYNTKLKEKENNYLREQKLKNEKILKESSEIIIFKELAHKKEFTEARNNLFENNTDYSREAKRNFYNFNCNSIYKLRRNCGLHDNLNRGIACLSGDAELRQYIYSLGNMHIEKLKDCFQNLITPKFFKHSFEKIEIFDWGCGQALGSVALIDQLKVYKEKQSFIDKVTLIEPCLDPLKRGSLHVQLALKNESKIYPINKYINSSLSITDMANSPNSIKFHIFSNIIDIKEFDNTFVSNLIFQNMSGINYIIAVGPLFGSYDFEEKDKKMDSFIDLFKKHPNTSFQEISKKENFRWRNNRTWTRKEITIKLTL